MKAPGLSPITAADGWFTGEDQTFRWTVYNSAGVAVDITGWTVQFKFAYTQTGAAVLTKSMTLTTPVSGICSAAIVAADTSGLTPTQGWYTATRTDVGNVQTFAYGPALLQGRPS